jgi:hypothetical protein
MRGDDAEIGELLLLLAEQVWRCCFPGFGIAVYTSLLME